MGTFLSPERGAAPVLQLKLKFQSEKSRAQYLQTRLPVPLGAAQLSGLCHNMITAVAVLQRRYLILQQENYKTNVRER